MQIRLTVVDPLGSPSEPRGRAAACDVLVTAPAGTALAAVAAGLASAVGGEGAGQHDRGREFGGGPVVLYAGAERLDGQRCTLGEPPLTDGAVLSLGCPAEPGPDVDGVAAQLHVVAGPDAGGVHLLHGGRIDIGRSADADVPLDDPDVSRLHCAVTVTPEGRVSVTDLGSTNGTTLDGTHVGTRPVRFGQGALLRVGESALRLAPPDGTDPVGTTPDGEGHVRVITATGTATSTATRPKPPADPGPSSSSAAPAASAAPVVPHTRVGGASGAGALPVPPAGDTHHGFGAAEWGAAGGAPEAQEHGPVVPGQGRAPRIENRPARPPGPDTSAGGATAHASARPEPGTRKGTPTRGTDISPEARRRGGIGAWARRLTGGRGELPGAGPGDPYNTDGDDGAAEFLAASLPTQAPESWPDPATLLLTALGPGPRLWERGPGHPETLTVRLGTADRAAPDGSGLVPAVPVTAGLREVGSLGLAGPRTRLAGLARSVVAQLAALHSPDALDIVLISADRSRTVEERTTEWSWLGWLPHLRPTHGQDCRLLLAYDREQATARTDELLRRLEDHLTETGGTRGAYDKADHAPVDARGGARRPSWARDEGPTGADRDFEGPFTVLVVDGDPGGADVREAVLRLTHEGPRAGIHVVCLAETASASPSPPVTETYEAAYAASPAFRECGAIALLSGDVATALRLMRVGSGGPVGHGTVAAVDAVSPAWAERFARALAPLRTDGTHADRHARVSAPLPQAARLLDELGLARATPASLMARWADAADDTEALGGRGRAVLGAGPRGPVAVDLPAEGPHLLIEGPPGSGRTELLRAIAASLAAAERPDRLGIVLMDGRDSTGGHGTVQGAEGLRVCTDLPHVTTHLTANDPVRMREFAQSLSAELKRRAELLGRLGFAEWHTRGEVSGRMVAQRTPKPAPGAKPGSASPSSSGAADLDTPPSSTLRLRPAAARERTDPGPPLARLVVIIDDLDALLSPALGSPGRPAAGSVVRALEAVAREGDRLGVHLVAAAADDGRTASTELGRAASLRIALDPVSPGADEPAPGRGRLSTPDGRLTPFQAGRVTGRIPRTATLRPTVVPLEWHLMGDPPARRPVRELGNGPTDLALLASALERAARSVAAVEVPSLL
ncbi:FHA domain-containing protein [Streptomyces sp. NBC_01483]|uniref:FHA domain-containing protein n=1 Tax=Streptomyces sp. NBC_01483 TaxID=2903883 RepID=UPI002E35E0C6|nr:FHA domain-containing protein [Streptomyces sp. NBC_01483]